MKYITPTIETDRLILKRGSFNDYKQVYEYDFTRLRDISGEFEFVKLDKDKLVGFDTYADEDNVLDFIVYLKDDMIPIGNIIYDRYSKDNNSLEVAYNLHPTYWGNGYITEALTSSMMYIFDNLNIDNIRCEFASDNLKSRRINEKLGFKVIGSHMEHYPRLNKDIEEIETIISKKNFHSLYKNIKKNK